MGKRIVATLALVAALTSGAGAKPLKCALKDGVSVADGARTLCLFDADTHRFAGAAADQARCLTRHVGMGAEIGVAELPQGLAELVGKKTELTVDALRRYAEGAKLTTHELGGDFGRPVTAEYFIIHDTSYPNCSMPDASASYCPVKGDFPPNRDRSDWAANKNFEGRPKTAPNRIANAFTNRIGQSVTEVDFADPFYTTKFEQCENGGSAIGRFVGVENIQPRLTWPRPTPAGKKMNDSEGPTPGFSDAQYQRLALLYVTASIRHGAWLIPAYHAVIDHYYKDNHDDPQNFEMPKFDAAVQAQIHAMGASTN